MADESRGTTRPIAGTHFYILLALADEPRYGLGIAEEVSERTDGEVRLGPGTLYNAVRKMLEDGLIEEWTPPDDEKVDPRRRYYRITEAGRDALAAEAEHLETLVTAAREKRAFRTA